MRRPSCRSGIRCDKIVELENILPVLCETMLDIFQARFYRKSQNHKTNQRMVRTQRKRALMIPISTFPFNTCRNPCRLCANNNIPGKRFSKAIHQTSTLSYFGPKNPSNDKPFCHRKQNNNTTVLQLIHTKKNRQARTQIHSVARTEQKLALRRAWSGKKFAPQKMAPPIVNLC